jgi:hypothetical protein
MTGKGRTCKLDLFQKHNIYSTIKSKTMKKITLVLIIGLLSILVFGTNTQAQNKFVYNSLPNDKTLMENVMNMGGPHNTSHGGSYVPDTKTIHAKAIKDFEGRFNHINNAMWFADQDGFEAYFTQEGFGDRVFYDKKGHWKYSLIFYNEFKLPTDLRAALKSTYMDMEIKQVEEVQYPDEVFYIVVLQDKSSIKVLKITNEGELKILQDLNRE